GVGDGPVAAGILGQNTGVCLGDDLPRLAHQIDRRDGFAQRLYAPQILVTCLQSDVMLVSGGQRQFRGNGTVAGARPPVEDGVFALVAVIAVDLQAQQIVLQWATQIEGGLVEVFA